MKNDKDNKDNIKSEALSLYVAGLSLREIARRLGVSKSTIARIITPQASTTPAKVQATNKQHTTVAGLNTPTATIIAPAQPAKDPIDHKDSVATKAIVGTHAVVDVNTMVANINEAISGIIEQIALVTPATTSIDKLATAADRLASIAERVINVSRITDNDNTTQSQFIADFTSRHQQHHKN
ncbi:MAG: helix-turn-helix domain-containing protein [Bacteroidaceae bacterium]|nr:helix-turn-helix domain-containing protein [Bacteroidaceae bacterium]